MEQIESILERDKPHGQFSRKIVVCHLFIVFITIAIILPAQNKMVVTRDGCWLLKKDSAAKVDLVKNNVEKEESEDALNEIERSPSFSIYRDNYFVTGIPLNKEVTNLSADASFQISIKQRLSSRILPFNTIAYLTYTQKSFWDIYAESSPFRDSNYNPGIGLGKYIKLKYKTIGAISLQIMHESNGRDGEDSRSWNYLRLSIRYYLNQNISLTGEFWPPFTEFGTNSKELIDYKGYGCITINYTMNNQRIWISSDILPRKGFGNFNTTHTAAIKFSPQSKQYLFISFYQGYGENQKDFRKYVINLRIGLCLKPNFLCIL